MSSVLSRPRPVGYRVIVGALAEEMALRLGGEIDPATVHDQVRAAVNDLRGSVSYESLPEMALRLAHHRMTGADRLP